MKKVIIILLMSCMFYSPVNNRNSSPNGLREQFIESHEYDHHSHKIIQAAKCPRCESFTLSTVPGYYEILYSEPTKCHHGYANGGDIVITRIYHGAYTHCSNCGYSTPGSVYAPETIFECHGYN